MLQQRLFDLPESFVPKGEDFYATPDGATREILNRIPLTGSILEPAAGDGHIIKVLKEFYPDNEIVGTELYQRDSNEDIKFGVDFLTYKWDRKFDNIITNPPFDLCKDFVERSLEIVNDKILIFAKLQLLEGLNRQQMFLDTPLHYVYVFSRRVSPLKNGSPVNEQGKDWRSTFATGWFIWEVGYEGEPIIRWI